MPRVIDHITNFIRPHRSQDSTSPLSPRSDSGISLSRSPPSPTSFSRAWDWLEKRLAPAYNRPTLSNSERSPETCSNQDWNFYTPSPRPNRSNPDSPQPSSRIWKRGDIKRSREGASLLSPTQDRLDNLESRRILSRPTAARAARDAQQRRVLEVLSIVKQLKNEEYSTDDILIVKELSESDFAVLIDRLETGDEELKRYFEHDLCYDYPYRIGRIDHIVFRMNSKLHEHVSRKIHRRLANWIDELKRDNTNPDGILSKAYYETGSARICFKRTPHGKSPDESIQFDGCEYPGLLIEISWSQKVKELPKRAKEFITKTKGGVRTVICIDVNDTYEKRRKKMAGEAKLSVWRANWTSDNKLRVEMSVNNEVFQDEQGQLNPSAGGLRLTLEDFVCRKAAAEIDVDDPHLVVEAKELYQWVQEGLAALNIPPPESSAGQSEASDQQALPASPPDSRAEGEGSSRDLAFTPNQPANSISRSFLPPRQEPTEPEVRRPLRRSRRLAALFKR
ncbi:uncharacterized protein F4812DRAFT_462130 [Daldinia caldariorum]|uniref:uncharacterized protein n=1 Tax=Daldinia caldariorum TaxID=326644 RepID=UPI0020081C2F|nr:uncharacterized protein F4812DRAFT_462130 [Daldinia caldariorum]KAI1464804.1 hypothetical protein F4812DRAFT_462130 [Daldinia caldariorum]